MLDLVDILADLKRITGITQSVGEKQANINVSDVWNGWDLLAAKYDLIETSNLLLNFARDDDLKLIIINILKYIEQGAAELEKTLAKHAIPLPPRPRQGSYAATNLEVITDRYIFRRLFEELKNFCPIILEACLNSTSPKPINFFKRYLIDTITIINNVSIYGEIKGYIEELPAYRPT